MVDLEEQLRAYGDVLDTEPAQGVSRNRRRVLLALAAMIPLIVGIVGVLASQRDTDLVDVSIPPPTTPSVLPTAGLRTVDRYAYGDAHGSPRVVLAGGDVWIAGFDGNQPVLDRRDPTTGRLIAHIRTPFHYGVGYMAAAEDALYVDGMFSDLAPSSGLARVDLLTNKTTTFKTRATDSVCECPIAASAEGLWEAGDHSVVRRDPKTLAQVARIPLLSTPTAIAVVGDTLQVGESDASIAVIDIATNEISATILTKQNELGPRNESIAAIAPLADNESWVLRSNGSLVTIIDGQMRVRIPVVPETALSNASATAVWVTGGNDVWGIPIGSDDDTIGRYIYDGDGFRPAATTTSVPGFVLAAAIGNELWLSRVDGEVIHAHVGP